MKQTNQSLEDIYRSDPVRACRMAIKQTSDIPATERLQAIDKLLHAYGTEAIRGDWENGYWCDIVACYVNMGETYMPTVLHVRTGKFIVASYGDWIEKNQKKYNIL